MKPLSLHVITAHPREFPYNTSGFWSWEGDVLCVAITPQATMEHAFLLAIHELVEAFLCRQDDIPDDAVTKFDIEFERRRKRGDNRKPGDHPCAPYWRQHQKAEKIERLLAKEMGVDWKSYLKGIK